MKCDNNGTIHIEFFENCIFENSFIPFNRISRTGVYVACCCDAKLLNSEFVPEAFFSISNCRYRVDITHPILYDKIDCV
jgi:hypothetical protein